METASYYSTGTEVQAAESAGFTNGNTEAQESNGQWGDAQHNLVAANAGVIVRCPWMGNAEVTLSAAMTNFSYPPNLTAEDEPHLISVVEGLLANRVVEEEEPKEKEETAQAEEEQPAEIEEKLPEDPEEEVAQPQKAAEEKKSTELESGKEQKNLEVDNKNERPGVTEQSQSIELPNSTVEKSFKTGNDKVATEKAAADNTAQRQLEQSAPEPVKAETTTRSSANSANTAKAGNLEATEEPVTASAKSTAEEIKGRKVNPMPASLESRHDNRSDEIEAVEVQKIEAPGQTVELETSELPAEYQKDGTILEDDIEPASAEIYGYPEVVADLSELAEEKIMIDQSEIEHNTEDEFLAFNSTAAEISNDILQITEESPTFQPVLENEVPPSEEENPSFEQPEPIILDIEEVEEFLMELEEHLQDSGPEAAEITNEILDKILEVPAKLGVGGDENIVSETEAREELEELFTELLDSMNVGYTLELIESLADMTLKEYGEDETEKPAGKEDLDKPAQDTGTHEIIISLLAATGSIKKGIEYASIIGKSALRLYRYSFIKT